MRHFFALTTLILLLTACGAAATPEPTITPVPQTPTPTDTPLPPGFEPVTGNADWTPVIEEYDGVKMALVPAGCFMMGSTDEQVDYAVNVLGGQHNWFTDEQPMHEVCFDEPFWIDVYEVTNAHFAAFLNEMGNQTEGGVTWLDAGDRHAPIGESGGTWAPLEGYDDHPVVEVTWYGAAAYCEWRGARLPTEAEWEYAARGPDGLLYPWGDYDGDNVVYEGTSGYHTWKVGSKPGGVSWVGALDMSGNVWEWVNDWYADSYPGEAQVNPSGPGSGEYRVVRGGSWSNLADLLRATNRNELEPEVSGATDGFRCALSWVQPEPAPADTPAPTTSLLPGFEPVTHNADWTPVIEEFGGTEMALVPAGCFMMGSEKGSSFERPVHEVCFEEPFWVDVYEVTNARFAEFLNEMGNQTEGGVTWLDADSEYVLIGESGGTWTPLEGYADHPVIEVTWYGAAAYCEWRGARLPTEAEWEYAARGPDGLAYPWGDDFDADNVIYGGNSGVHTWEVGSRPGGVSWVGALDMSGNVREWVNDRYGAYPGGPQVDPAGPGSGEYRVWRGGSWGDCTGTVRAASRYRSLPDNTWDGNGFRCALSYAD